MEKGINKNSKEQTKTDDKIFYLNYTKKKQEMIKEEINKMFKELNISQLED
ncbi:MAG: hypothetical protein NC935_02165 [Candidatus Omnitrophica bacterium]|nr:hypothetical protein [Candidatus Omnitrophota bacterium]